MTTETPTIPTTPDANGFVTEHWTYAGVALTTAGKRRYCWHSPTGLLTFGKGSAAHVIGGVYAVPAKRTESGGVSRYEPAYTGELDPDRDRTVADTLTDRAARARLARAATERSDAKRDAVAEALDGLRRVAGQVRGRPERDALVAAAIDVIYGRR
jgi:hypothetical protein